MTAAEWRRFVADQHAQGRAHIEQLADQTRARLGLPDGQAEREAAAHDAWFRETITRIRAAEHYGVLSSRSFVKPFYLASVT